MEEKNICGERIRLARLKLRMKQIDLAAALEVDHGIKLDASTIGRIERGERGLYDFVLLALSEILEVPVDWLLKGGDLPVK